MKRHSFLNSIGVTGLGLSVTSAPTIPYSSTGPQPHADNQIYFNRFAGL